MTRRAQVLGTNAVVVNEGEVDGVGIDARLPRPLLLLFCGPCSLRRAGRALIGGGGPVPIQARPLRPSGRLRRSRRLPRAQVSSATTQLTVSDPGFAVVQVRDPRLLRPPARKRRNYETQALGFPFTFKCSDTDVMVPKDGSAVCPEEP